jgi:hypothetical protein
MLNKMTHQCKFCNTVLATEHSLSKHQKTAKKCLKKQGTSIPEGNFKSDVCDQTFIFKSVLSSHIISCTKKNSSKIQIKIKIHEENSLLKCKLLELETKYNIDRKELETKYNIDRKEFETKYNMLLEEKKEWKEKEEKLLDKITNAALSKTNNTNTVKNNINITTYTRTDEELKSIYEQNLTPSHIEGGISAIAKLIVDKVVTDDNGVKMITITDKARGTARYKLPSGENVVDNGLNIFTTKNRDILMKRISSIAASDTICDQILDIDTTISKGYTEISDDVEGDVLRSSLIKSI